ncbi:MAG: hypothetical protein DWQ02_06990 [Bacteroidetes bacterium]|nr:MAG: hypothetical protein DWQ02_06990 [Bacteroidota bacterium]
MYQSIDDIINALEEIIQDSIRNNDPLGYFAALYQKVTIKVKEGINQGYFNDNERMEKLDIVFAKRYLDAYHDYHKNLPVTDSWKKAFDASKWYWPIVLQHLLLGMNAHISLDLGIAAAEVSEEGNLDDLHDDFNKINEVLSDLVDEVENNLAEIWPTFKLILKLTRRVDNFLVDFSMKKARDGAWKFAQALANGTASNIDDQIAERDKKVAGKVNLILHPGWFLRLIFAVIRIGERGSVSDKIQMLEAKA